MKWFRKSMLWASLGYFGVTASAQDTQWRPSADEFKDPLVAVRPVSLGRPAPLPVVGQAGEVRVVSAFVPVRQSSAFASAMAPQYPPPSVVRGARPTAEDEPRFLPKDLAPQPSTGNTAPPAPPPTGLPPASKENVKVVPSVPKTVQTSSMVFPGIPSTVVDGRPLYTDESGRILFDDGGETRAKFYGSAEYLLWWTKGFHLPPLVTTASPLDPLNTRGALGFDSTRLICGDSTTSTGPTSGARFTIGYAADPCGQWAVEGNYFFLGQKRDNARFDSNEFPVLARPFFNINEGRQDRELPISPGLVPREFKTSGSLQIDTSSSLLGAEANMRVLLCCGCDYQVTGIVGVRYLQLRENVGIVEDITVQIPPPAFPGVAPVRAGDVITVFDSFETRNRFIGAQVGMNAEWQRGPWSLEARFKLALGATHQTVDINGGQRIVSLDGRDQSFIGGLLAVPGNIGQQSQTRFGVVPEIGLKVGYDLSENVRIFVGYDFLYWSSVLRPGDQIDLALDVNRIPNSGGGPPATQVRPILPFRTSSYWAHGVNAGLEFRY